MSLKSTQILQYSTSIHFNFVSYLLLNKITNSINLNCEMGKPR